MSITLNRTVKTPQEAVNDFSNHSNTQKVAVGYMPYTIPAMESREWLVRFFPIDLLEQYLRSGSKESIIDFNYNIDENPFHRHIVYHETDKGSVPCMNFLRLIPERRNGHEEYCDICGTRFKILDLPPSDDKKLEYLKSKGKTFNSNGLEDKFFESNVEKKLQKGIQPTKTYLYLMYVHQFPSDYIENNNSVDYLPKLNNRMLFVAKVNKKTHESINASLEFYLNKKNNEQFIKSIDPRIDVAPYFTLNFKASLEKPKDPKSKKLISLVLSLSDDNCEYSDDLKKELSDVKEGKIKPEDTMLFGKSNVKQVIVEDKYDADKQKAAFNFAKSQMNAIFRQKNREDLLLPIDNTNAVVVNMSSQANQKHRCFGSFSEGDTDCIKCSYLTQCESATGRPTVPTVPTVPVPSSKAALDNNIKALTHSVSESNFDDDVPF